MGLDMYLRGTIFTMGSPMKKDGYNVCSMVLELGYWRKHPDLHGFIVNTFADGVDECQQIELERKDLVRIIEAVEKKQLPHTEGFFFGSTDGSEDEETLQILRKALAWWDSKEDNLYKDVYYQASW